MSKHATILLLFTYSTPRQAHQARQMKSLWIRKKIICCSDNTSGITTVTKLCCLSSARKAGLSRITGNLSQKPDNVARQVLNIKQTVTWANMLCCFGKHH